jgi:hypothetical protein
VPILPTKRDLEILDALTRRIRVLSLDQIARTWWQDAGNRNRVAENRLRELAGENLLHLERAPAHPELTLEAPVTVWTTNDPEPEWGAVSYKLQTRWRSHPETTLCVSASKTAVNRFGGHGGRPPRSVERTHDIHMAQVYLIYREKYPELLAHWVFEEKIKAERRREAREATYGQKLPDVILRSGRDIRVVEFGGAYGKDKLVSFHRYCKEHAFPYEIW